MLYQVGPLTLDTFPASVTGVEREDSQDYAKHDLINMARAYEHEGPGDDTLTLRGEVMPFHIGGLGEIEFARALKNSGRPQYVMRGDGAVLGWYVITALRDAHDGEIAPNGVGYKVKYEIKLEACGGVDESTGADLVRTFLNLFG